MSSDEEHDELLTPAECAALWNVDPKTITRWAKAGKLPAVRTLGGHRRFRKSEVMALLNRPAESERDPLKAPVHTLWPSKPTGSARTLLKHIRDAGVATVGDLTACGASSLEEYGLRPIQIDHVRLALHRKGLALLGEVLGDAA